MNECRICGAGWVRPTCAPWCDRIAALLRRPESFVSTPAERARWRAEGQRRRAKRKAAAA